MAMILENLRKRVLKELHINDISLQLEPGTFNILLGRTLSGKTALMRLMVGLDRPTCGRSLGNDGDLNPARTVYMNIALPHGPSWQEGLKLGCQDCGSWPPIFVHSR